MHVGNDGTYCAFDVVPDGAPLGLSRHQFHDASFGYITYWTREDASSAAGEGTLFLHGVGGTWSSWTPLLQQADSNGVLLGTIVIVDLPGFGASQNLQVNLDVVEVGDLLLRLADHLSLTRLHLVGQSMGGYLALMMASQYKERLYAVTAFSGTLFRLSAPNTRWAGLTEVLLRGRRRQITYRALRGVGVVIRQIAWLGALTGILRITLRKVAAYPERIPAGFLKSIARGIRPECYLLALENTQRYTPLAHWKKIEVSTSAAFGEHDRNGGGPIEANVLKRECPQITSIVLGACGHYIPLEQPAAALEIIVAKRAIGSTMPAEEVPRPVLETPSSEVGGMEVYRTWRDDVRRHRTDIGFWAKRMPVILAPLVIPLITLTATRGLQAVRQPSCDTLDIVRLIGSKPNETPVPCTAAVFVADLPSLTLAVGCVALFILHFRWQLAFKELYVSLREGRLLRSEFKNIAESAKDTVRMRPRYLLWLPLFMLIVMYFYYLTYDSQNLVQDLMKHQVTIINGAERHPAIGRGTWWADFHGRNIVNAIMWCGVGIATFSIGMFDQFRLRRITAWFKKNASYLTQDYRPIYKLDGLNDDPFGLNCVYALIELKRWGGVVLCGSSAAIFYLIRTSEVILFDFFALIVVSALLVVWYVPLHQLRRFVEGHLRAAVECARLRYALDLRDPRRPYEQTLTNRFELEQILALASAGNRSMLGSWTQRAILAITVLAAIGGLYPVLLGS